VSVAGVDAGVEAGVLAGSRPVSLPEWHSGELSIRCVAEAGRDADVGVLPAPFRVGAGVVTGTGVFMD